MKTGSLTPLASSAPRGFGGSRGSALFLVLILSVVSAVIMAAIVTYTSHTTRMEQRSNSRLESTYAAEYAMEKAYQQLTTLAAQDFSALPTISQITAVTNVSTAPSDVFTTAMGYTWKAFLTLPIEDGVVVGSHSGFNATQGRYKFLTVAEFTRLVPRQAPEQMQFQREWVYVITPLFQYAIFYNGDMELFPGANFVVNGRVHTNGRIFTGTSASITFTDYVSHVDGFSNNYSPNDPRSPGSPGSNIDYEKGPAVATTREDPPGTLNQNTGDSNNNNDGPRELIELADYVQTDVNAADRLYTKAGLKILINTTGSAVTSLNGVAVGANSRVLKTLDGTTIPSTDPLATYLNSTAGTRLFESGTTAAYNVNDYRQGVTVTTTDIDVARIKSAYDAGGLPQTIPNAATWPNTTAVPAPLRNAAINAAIRGKAFWNGVVYATDITHSTSRKVGLRLINGSSLPDGTNTSSPTPGLTIASQNPAYIVGNYNTGGAPPVNSGTDLAANNYASGYTVRPAAVIADAVTVVSANWTGSTYNSVSTLDSRNAANTTINAALISGIVNSNGTAYSGGVENYIRLLEDWGGCRLTYYGSIINLYQSAQATAVWQNTGVYYQAPTRNWYFDVNFLDPNKLPPGTPITRSLKRGQWAQIR